MENRVIRLALSEDLYRKYKVYCAIQNVSMTQMTSNIVKKFIDEQKENIKIIKVKE